MSEPRFKFATARRAFQGSIMPLKITLPMRKRLTRRALEMLERSLLCFPELAHATITVGHTRKHLGSATVVYHRGAVWRLTIRLRVRGLSYQTIGHELTHLVQGLARGNRVKPPRRGGDTIPSGEKQCDIWTLARDRLFCDDAPTYLRLPRLTRARWHDYAGDIRRLCLAAIERRKTQRLYIRWLEAEIRALVESPRAPKLEPQQLALPFEK